MAGPQIARVETPAQHQSRRQQIIAWISTRLFDRVTYTVRHGLLKGMKRRGGLGWLPRENAWTAEDHFWAGLDLRGMVAYDIGAFHGLLTLWFARSADRVVAFEPNSANRRRLQENLALNRIVNVTVLPMGAGSRCEERTMVTDRLRPGFAAVDGVGTIAEKITLTTVDHEVAGGLQPPDFIKIDTEGFELEVLTGARETVTTYRPALFLEMHGNTMEAKRRNAAAIVEFLWAIGYRDICHVETSTPIALDNSNVAAEGHLWCPADRIKARIHQGSR